MTETATHVSLSETQRQEVLALLDGYFGSDKAMEQAANAAKNAVTRFVNDDIRTTLVETVKADPNKALEQLFRNSGAVVKTRASEVFDGIVEGIMRDEASGVPEAVRQYVRDHLPELIQRAVTEIITTMVIDYLKDNATSLAGANHALIRTAFMNARMSPGY